MPRQQEYYYEDDVEEAEDQQQFEDEEEEEDENLTYEQIIREDAVPRRDARGNQPIKNFPHVQPQYMPQGSAKGYGNPAIFCKIWLEIVLN